MRGCKTGKEDKESGEQNQTERDEESKIRENNKRIKRNKREEEFQRMFWKKGRGEESNGRRKENTGK